MVYQLTDLCTKTTRGYVTPFELKNAVMTLTKDLAETESVFEWATNPVIGGIQYDGPSFSIRIFE